MSETRAALIKSLFQKAVELPEAQRAEYLHAQCGLDNTLLDEIQVLLVHADAMPPNFLGGEVVDADAANQGITTANRSQASPRPHPDADEDDLLGIPEQFGKFQIVRLIGIGGMGAVYEARQPYPRRTVALKVLRPGLITRERTRRFEREADLLGRLQHPGIAHVYEAGVADTSDGKRPFLAMELIDGQPLDEWARDADRSVRDRLEMMVKICDAIDHAHQRAIMHRDLKPTNILVDQRGQAKVLDFGIARATEADVHVVTLDTAPGQLLGTLPYMSPEQVAGDQRQLDVRSDVYALGVLLYELLSGRLPYDVRHRSIHEAARLICEEEPTRLSASDTSLRGDLETIVAKALEKDRVRRYQSARALATDLRRFLDDRPILARPASRFYQLRKFARRNKMLVGGVTATFISLVIGLVSATWLALREADARQESNRALYRSSLAAAAGALRENDIATAERHLLSTPEELRRWEWHHLVSRLDESMASAEFAAPALGSGLPATRGLVHAWFSDTDRKVHVARRRVGRQNSRLEVDTWQASASAGIAQLGSWSLDEVGLFAPVVSGDALFVQSQDGQATVRELMQGALRESFAGPPVSPQVFIQSRVSESAAADQLRILTPIMERGAEHVVFSADGQHICTAAESIVSVVHAAKPNDSLTLEPHIEGVGAAVFTPDGRYLVTAGNNRQLACYDLDDGGRRVWQQLDAHRDAILAAAISPDGGLLATGGQDCVLRLWDTRTGQPRGAMVGHKNPMFALSFSDDGNQLVSCSGNRVRIWQLEAAGDLEVMRGHTSFVRSLAMSPDGALLASGSRELRIWDVHSGMLVLESQGDGQSPRDIVLRDSASSVSAPSPRPTHKAGLPVTMYNRLSFSPDGRHLLVNVGEYVDGQRMNSSFIMDVRTGRTIHTFEPHADHMPIAYGSAGQFLLAIGAEAGKPALLDADTYEIAMLLGSQHARYSFDRDGKRLAIVDSQSQRIVDLPTGKTLQSWTYSTTRMHTLVRDGAVLALATPDGGIALLDVASGREIGVLRGHTGKVLCFAELPGASRNTSGLISGADDRTIRLWDLDAMDELTVLRGHTDTVWDLAVTPDGKTVFSASGDYTIRRWDTRPLRDILAARTEYKRIAEKLTPRVNALLDEREGPAAAADHIAADKTLSKREHQIAQQLLLGISASRSKRAESGAGAGERHGAE
jgi:serine/threonine protein kinase/WD40 repeat protein